MLRLDYQPPFGKRARAPPRIEPIASLTTHNHSFLPVLCVSFLKAACWPKYIYGLLLSIMFQCAFGSFKKFSKYVRQFVTISPKKRLSAVTSLAWKTALSLARSEMTAIKVISGYAVLSSSRAIPWVSFSRFYLNFPKKTLLWSHPLEPQIREYHWGQEGILNVMKLRGGVVWKVSDLLQDNHLT